MWCLLILEMFVSVELEYLLKFQLKNQKFLIFANLLIFTIN